MSLPRKMERMGNLEKKYVCDVIDRAFSTSQNSFYNNKLEKSFAERFSEKYAIGHTNGTSTLHTAVAACGIKAGEEVIVPSLTMSSTCLGPLQNGSIPVFADVDKETFCLDPASVEKCITPKTKAVLPVSLYGGVPDYDGLLAVCKKHNLKLIEDNAECFLGEYKGRLVGTIGDFASFSFQASKHLTAGEGGMLITNDLDLANSARTFNTLGYAGVSATQGKITRESIQDPKYSRHINFGFNYRMSELQAAVALAQLERAEELVERRIEVARLFEQAVAGSDLVTVQKTLPNCKNTYWAYSMVLKTDNPETDWYKFRDLFKKNGGDGYYAAWKLGYEEPFYQNTVQKMPGVWQKYNKDLCPVAEYLQPRMIQLKTNYWDIAEAEKQAEILAKTLKEF